jgi:hypothetical protein
MDQKNEAPQEGPKKRKKNYQGSSKPIPIRYPHEERDKILTAAKDLNLSASEYLRKKAENGSITVRTIDSKYEKLIFELNMVGNNLRQAVKLFYTHGDPYSAGETLNSLALEIAKTINEIRHKMTE